MSNFKSVLMDAICILLRLMRIIYLAPFVTKAVGKPFAVTSFREGCPDQAARYEAKCIVQLMAVALIGMVV